MPTALERLLTCPAALRSLVLQRCLQAPVRRFYTSDGVQPELHANALPKEQNTSGRHDLETKDSDPLAPLIPRKELERPPKSALTGPEPLSNHTSTESVTPVQTSLWADALLYRERIDGLEGIRDVFEDMTYRGYKLPLDDTPEAGIIWGTLVKNRDVAMRALDYAVHVRKTSGRIYPLLYENYIAFWLARNTNFARKIHHRMVIDLRLRRLPLRRLAQIMRPHFSLKALDEFMDIYRTSLERDLYDEIVPMLCDRGEIALARRWHAMCFHRKDFPSPSVASHPLVQLFIAEYSPLSAADAARLGEDKGTLIKHLEIDNDTVRVKRSRHNEELMRRLTGRDRAPVRFDDAFCARLFATKAFSPASIIRGLVLAGINEIGPQAVRYMGLRSDPIEELPYRFHELREAGIALQGCVFSLALEKFALDGRFNLVRSLLDSDQHPDVFDDAHVQKELLHQYLDNGDRMQAHRTLAILALFHNDASTESWNLMLQARIKQFNPHQVVRILEDMRDHKVMVSVESMASLRSILRPRRRGRRPNVTIPSDVDDIRFLSRCYILILESGIGMILPFAWNEIIRRLGISRRLRELRRLLLWLLAWYAPQGSPTFASVPRSPFLENATKKLRIVYPEKFQYFNLPPHLPQSYHRHPLNQLFPKKFQHALVVWGFRSHLRHNPNYEQSLLSPIATKPHYRHRFLKSGILKRPHWSYGLRILVELRDLGVEIDRRVVNRALLMEFKLLFGKGRSRKKENRVMREVNGEVLSAYVKEVNAVWGREGLFPDERALGVRMGARRSEGRGDGRRGWG